MSDKKQNKNTDSDLNQEEEKSGLLYEDVSPEVYEDDDQIRVSDLLDIIWAGRLKILIITILFFCLAIFHVVSAPDEYLAESTFLPERQVQQFQMDRMFAFGELARSLNIGGSQSDGSLPSYFYPEIIASVEFQSELLAKEVELYNEGRTVTLFEYFTDVYEQPFRVRFYNSIRNYTIGLPMKFFRLITNIFTPRDETGQTPVLESTEVDNDEKSPNIMNNHVIHQDRFYILSPQYIAASESIVERTQIDYGTLTIAVSTRMPDPLAAVQLNAYVADMLQNYLIEYRIEKARQNLQYIEALYEEAEERYERTTYELALFEDSNMGNLSAVADIERERLRERKNLAYSLYTSVASRLEEARTRLKEDTPIYTTFQDPEFSTQSIGASIYLLPASIFIGLFLGVIWLFIEKMLFVFVRTFTSADSLRDSNKE